MEGVKILKVQRRGTPRRNGARNVRKVVAGTGEALPGPGPAAREQPVRITAEREIASSRVGVGGVVVAITGEDNITRRSKGPLLRLCLIDWEESVHGRCA